MGIFRTKYYGSRFLVSAIMYNYQLNEEPLDE